MEYAERRCPEDVLRDAWVDDEAVRNRILTENPAELYGF